MPTENNICHVLPFSVEQFVCGFRHFRKLSVAGLPQHRGDDLLFKVTGKTQFSQLTLKLNPVSCLFCKHVVLLTQVEVERLEKHVSALLCVLCGMKTIKVRTFFTAEMFRVQQVSKSLAMVCAGACSRRSGRERQLLGCDCCLLH